MKDVVIFGGTFDPVHKGHTAIIEHLKKRFSNTVVVPCGTPPHKLGTNAKDRLAMLKQVVDTNLIDTLEIDNTDISYTYKTVEHYAGIYDKVYLCIGSDSLMDFTTWKNPDRIASLAAFYVIPRENTHLELDQFSQFIRTMYKAEIIIADFGAGDISSTEIRLRAAFGDYSLIEKSVADYIKAHRLYTEFQKYTNKYKVYNLSENRISHTMRVALMAAKLASKNHMSHDIAITAALLHDIAKQMTVDEARDKGYITNEEYVDIEFLEKPVRHSFIGANVAKWDFGVVDEDILNAIRFHTTGRPNMSQLEKIVMLADYIEEGRNFVNVEKIRELTFCDLDAGLIATFENTIQYLRAEKRAICQLTIDAYNYYMLDRE